MLVIDFFKSFVARDSAWIKCGKVEWFAASVVCVWADPYMEFRANYYSELFGFHAFGVFWGAGLGGLLGTLERVLGCGSLDVMHSASSCWK
ncbi:MULTISPECIES: hypothetical protein [Pseudomonas]|uniref:hypothetical protein n=1 Tax=Pseudomonas TaxID=286 RepID=UPI00117BB4D4|nr:MULTISPECIES: hypothetical protein [Pseudomonas]